MFGKIAHKPILNDMIFGSIFEGAKGQSLKLQKSPLNFPKIANYPYYTKMNSDLDQTSHTQS